MKVKAAKQWIRIRLARGKKWQRLIGWGSSIQLTFSAPSLALAVGMAGGLLAPQADAATLTWDPLITNNGGVINDGPGTWTAANVWNNGAGNQTWNSVTPDSAIFQGTAAAPATVNLASNITAGTVAINGTQNYTFGGAFTMATTGGLTVNSSGTITINSNIGGPGGITKLGNGTLILSGTSTTANTYGNVSVEEGVLRLSNATTLNPTTSRAITVASGAALEVRANVFGPVVTATPITMELNGDGIGGAGALRISSSSQSYGSGMRIVLGSDAKIATDGLIPTGVVLSGVVDVGSHVLTWGGDGTTNPPAALVTVNSFFRGTTGGFTLDLANANSLFTFANAQSNTYTGQTWVKGGRMSINKGQANNGVRGDGIARVSGTNTNGTLADLYIGGGSVAASVSVVGSGTDAIADSAEVFMAGTGAPTLNIGTSGAVNDTIGSLASANPLATVNLFTGSTLTLNNGNAGSDGSGNTTYAGLVAGAGNLAKSRSGTFTLTGANTYTGLTTVRQGAINIQNALALGTAAAGTTVLSGAALQLQNGITVAGEALTLAGFGVANDGALRNISGDNTWAGTVSLANSTRINSDADLLTIANNITGTNRGLTVGGAGDTAITGAIATGTGGLIKDGAGTLTLTGASTYTGTTAVNGGTLQLNFSASVPTNVLYNNVAPGALVLGGGNLMLTGAAGQTNAQTFNGLGGVGGTLNLNANGATGLRANLGAIDRTGAFNFTGADTTVAGGLAVPGISNYSTTTVAGANNGLGRIGGSLWNGSTWASTATDGSTTFVVPWQGVFEDVRTNSYNLNPGGFTNVDGDLRILDANDLTQPGSGTAVTYNANTTVSSMFMVAPTYDTTIAITAGTILNMDDGTGFGAIAIGGTAQSLTLGNVVNRGTITSGTTAGAGLSLQNANPASELIVNSVIADNAGGAVSLNTQGSVILNGTNTYTGDTGIAAGTLQIAGGGSLGAGNYAGDIVNEGLLQYSSSVDQTLAGDISGGGGVTKDGTGDLILTGTNSYTGNTTIGTGTLQIAGGGTLGDGNYLGAISNNGTLQYSSSADQTLAGAISGTGLLLKDGTGNLILTGSNSYTGDTIIDTGLLRVAGAGSLGSGTYAGTITNDGTFQYSATTTQVLTGTITGSGKLVKDGIGVLSLTGTNTYGGSTTVFGGTLELDFAAGGTSNIAPTTSSLIMNGGTLEMKGGVGESNTQIFSGLGGTSGTLRLTENAAADLTLNLGTINTAGAYNFVGGDTDSGSLIAIPGDFNFVTTTQVGDNDAATKMGASIWSYNDGRPDTWASTAAFGGITYVVPWDGTFTTLTTNSSFTNTLGDLRIIDGTNIGTATTYNSNSVIGSLLMVAPTYSTTVGIAANTTLTVGSGDGALGVIAISSTGRSLTIGNVANPSVLTAGTGSSDSTLVLQNLDTVVNPGTALTVNAAINNNAQGGEVSLTSTGLVVLAATNSYTGGTIISGGTLQITGSGKLGGASGIYGEDITNNGTLRYSSSAAQTFSGIISGVGGVTKDATSILTLTNANSYEGDTLVNNGVVNIRNSTALGSTAGGTAVAAGAALELQGGIAVGDEALTLNGTGVGGTGALHNIAGSNSWGGDITLTGATRIQSDAGTTLTINGDILGVDHNLTVGGNGGNTIITGVIGTNSGALIKEDTGTLTLSGDNTYAGPTTVTAGALFINGNQSGATGATSIASGATLGGTGTIGGGVTLANGATLAPGGNTPNPGTLTINGNLSLGGDSTALNYSFGQAGVPGGALNDLVRVQGNLTLDGVINVTESAGGAFGPGVYRVIGYSGSLTNNGLTLGSMPAGSSVIVQTVIPNQVNLVNTAGLVANIWDGPTGTPGDGVVTGYNGTWELSPNVHWTDASATANVAYANDSFAIFQGTPGTVVVSNGLGQVGASGMQFAVDGYEISGGPLALSGANPIIRVGDGTVDGAGYTATISAELTSTTGLTKTDLGTLVLGADNTYTGGTTISGGTVQLGSGGGTGGIAGNVLNNGTLAFNRSNTLTMGGVISGTGAVNQIGDGTTILTGNNSYTGGTTISSGTLQLGNGGGTGGIVGNVVNDGTLVINRSNTLALGGVISGGGTMNQIGDGATILTGNNTYSGPTNVTNGSLYVNGNQSAAAGLTSVASGATLGGKGTIGGSVTMAGGSILAPGGNTAAPGALTINGNLFLSNSTALNYSFGQAGVPGGALNDLTTVAGDLTLDGVINVTESVGGAFGPGVFRVIGYSGSLTKNGLTLGTMPAGSTVFVQTSVANQVNLVNTQGLTLSIWDGPAGSPNDGVITGGNGTWQLSSDEHWTDAPGTANAPYANDSFAIFQGAPGTVTVSNGLGQVGASGMQFAVDGYVIAGGPLALTGANPIIRVGDGTLAGAGYTTIIDAVLTGTTGMTKADLGTLVLKDSNTYTGGTTITGGTLQLGAGGSTGSIVGNVVNNGTLAFNRSNAVTFGGLISGTGGVNQIGGGTMILNAKNTYTGPANVTNGALYVNGDQTAATGLTSVAGGATLGGKGTIGGSVNLADGATLAPGGKTAAPGTLTIKRNLSLNNTTALNYSFGQAGVPGGAFNDLTVVQGDLTLDGIINVTESAGGNFGPGVYRVISYSGSLTDNGLELGAMPAGSEAVVQTTIAKQVNLAWSLGQAISFWDGPAGSSNDGDITGGNGTWELSPNTHWTDANGGLNDPYANDSFAVFQGTPGTVTVSNGLGQVGTSGMQFATDGYVIAGGPLALTGANPIIRVGDGTTVGAAYTATINAALTGSTGLTKTDLGTLVLNGANTYTGTTNINHGGTLRINGSSTGNGDFNLNDGTLELTKTARVLAANYRQSSNGILALDALAPNPSLFISGNARLAGNVTVANVDSLSGVVSKTLVDVKGDVSGSFNLAEGEKIGDAGDLSYLWSYSLGDGNDLGIATAFNPDSTLPCMVQDHMLMARQMGLSSLEELEYRLRLYRDSDGQKRVEGSLGEGKGGLEFLYGTLTHHDYHRDDCLDAQGQRMAVGYENSINGDSFVGAQFSLGQQDWDGDCGSGEAVDARLSVYGQRELKNRIYLEAAAGVGLLDFESDRGQQSGETDGMDLTSMVRVVWRAVDVKTPEFMSRLEPYVGVRGLHMQINDYTEDGDLAFDVSKQSELLGQAFLGLTWSQWFDLAPDKSKAIGYHLEVEGMLGANCLIDSSRISLSGVAPYQVTSPEEDTYGVRISSGLVYRFGNWSTSLDGGVGMYEHTQDWNTRLQLTWEW